MNALLLALALVPGPADPVVRIGLGSCLHQDKPQPVWKGILEAKPDTFLWLGDNIYASTPEIADKPKQYAKLAAQPGFQALKKSSRMLAIWDDHDYGINDGGAEYADRGQAQKEFHEFWGNRPATPHEGTYDAVTYGPEGQRVQFVMLDTRYFRSALNRQNNVDGSYNQYVPTNKGTMLGETQWAWLEAKLREPADLRIVMSSIQVIPEDHWFEKWSNLPAERTRLFELIGKTGAKGVLFVSGDRHLAELSLLPTSAAGYPLYDLTASALNQSRSAWRAHEVNRWRVATMNYGDNFGMILLDWRKRTVTMQIRDIENQVVLSQTVGIDLLQPRN